MEDYQILYIVGKVRNNKSWEFVGVFSDKEVAEKACLDQTYFVGPAELNRNVDGPCEEWPGVYYPREVPF